MVLECLKPSQGNQTPFSYKALHWGTSEQKDRGKERWTRYIGWGRGEKKGGDSQNVGRFLLISLETTEERALEPVSLTGYPGLPFAPKSIENEQQKSTGVKTHEKVNLE